MPVSSSPHRVHEGALAAAGRRFAIVAARWNDFVGDKLLRGAEDALRRAGAAPGNVEIFRCPGALELPALVRRVVDTGRFQGVVVLGVVIRGATPHFDVVVGQCASGVARIAESGRVAIGFGVLTCDTIEQAVERAGSKAGNKGAEAALVAVEMADLFARLEDAPPERAARPAAGPSGRRRK